MEKILENTTPLIARVTEGGVHGSDNRWKRVVDWEEAKIQILFSLPMILTNLAYYAIPLVSVMFAGHLGEVELAAANLANSWATVTGFSFMIGLSGALETLCGQGFGAKLYRMLGIYLQSSCLISIFFSILISILWFYTEPILILLQQDPQISKMAALYLKYLVPGLFAYALLHNMLRFLQTQSVVYPLVLCSLVPLILHIAITYLLVYHTSLAFIGAAMAVSVSMWIAVLMLAGYALFSRQFKETWQGFSMESFDHVVVTLKLALPSAAMVCLEYWAFELLVLLAGILPDSEITTSLIAMCVNTEAIAYMLTYGLSAAASTRVSNELGAGNIDSAKHAMTVTLKLSVVLALAVVLALGFGHDIWARFFSDSHTIITKYASMTPLLMISIILDSIQGVLSGVARGCGWQHLAVYINLAMFYFIGMPVAVALAFLLKLYAKGLWIGLICGLSCQTGSLLLLVYLNKWTRAQLKDFKYDGRSDSVLVVNKSDYDGCNGNNPVMKLEVGNSTFKFDRSGPFYFITGNKSNCDQGQKLIVVVLAVRNRSPPPYAATPPSPAISPVSTPLAPSPGGDAPTPGSGGGGVPTPGSGGGGAPTPGSGGGVPFPRGGGGNNPSADTTTPPPSAATPPLFGGIIALGVTVIFALWGIY